MENIMQQLRQAVDQAVEKGWSINAIAKASGITRTTLQQWHSETRPSMDARNAAALAEWLGMRLTKPRISKPPE